MGLGFIKVMLKSEVTINGKAYPCRETMGAMLRYKKETGEEVTEMGGSLEGLITYVWCCTASACKADGVDFDLSLQDFADKVDYDEFEKMQRMQSAGVSEPGDTDGGAGEKKS